MPAEQPADLEMGLNEQLSTIKLRANPCVLCALKMSLAVMTEAFCKPVCVCVPFVAHFSVTLICA